MKNISRRSLVVFFTTLVIIVGVDIADAKSLELHSTDKVKNFIDNVSDSLKKAVEEVGDDCVKVQNYLDNYHWKGLLQDEATSGAVTLKNLQLNNHSKVVVVKPGERVEGIVQCNLDREQCSALTVYRVVLGIKGVGPQTTIGNELGLLAGESLERFSLIAPSKDGTYQVCFRAAQGLLQKTALDAWIDENGNEPDATTAIGIIFVKS